MSCQYGCATKAEHHSKYARMRRTTRIEIITKSTKVNWDVVEKLKLDKPIIRKKREKRNGRLETGGLFSRRGEWGGGGRELSFANIYSFSRVGFSFFSSLTSVFFVIYIFFFVFFFRFLSYFLFRSLV